MIAKITKATFHAGLMLLVAAATVFGELPKNLDDDYISENKAITLHGKSVRAADEQGLKKLNIVTPTLGKLDAVDALDTDKLVEMAGQIVTVQGVVMRTYHDQKGDTRFFNFDKKREKFSFVMFASVAKQYQEQGDPVDYFLEKKIQVTGVLTIHKGKPSMVVSKPDQIVLVR